MKTILQSINVDEILDIDYYIEITEKLIGLLHTVSKDPIGKVAISVVLFITILKIILKYRKNN